jgi:hypothetical protein
MDRARTSLNDDSGERKAAVGGGEQKPSKYAFKLGKQMESKFLAEQARKAQEVRFRTCLHVS